MAKPYSNDLRERVVHSVLLEGAEPRRVAALFGIGVTTVRRWVHRFRTMGSVAPGQVGGHKPRSIRGADEAWLRQRLGERDFTLRGLVSELAERGLKVDYRSVWNFVHAEKSNFKRSRTRQRT